MRAIVRNKLTDAFRRRHGQVSVPIDNLLGDLASDDGPDPLAGHDIDRMLMQLKETERTIVQSISLKGNSVAETAERLDMNAVSVRVALHQALKRLAVIYRSDIK